MYLTGVTIPDGIMAIGGRALADSSLADVSIPATVTSITSNAFAGCERLTDVIIPDGVTDIGGRAFAYSGLTGATIPASVTAIGKDAFIGCAEIVLRVREGTAAEQYAKEHTMPFCTQCGKSAPCCHLRVCIGLHFYMQKSPLIRASFSSKAID